MKKSLFDAKMAFINFLRMLNNLLVYCDALDRVSATINENIPLC